MTYEFEFEDHNLVCVVSNVKVYGRDRPATFHDPAEYAELDSYDLQVFVCDEDGNETELSEHEGRELIESLDLWTDLEDRIWDAITSDRDGDY